MHFLLKTLILLAILTPVLAGADETVTTTYPSGRVKDKFTLDSQNRPHGTYQTFYDTVDAKTRKQPVKGEAVFKNGLLDGVYRRLYLNGQPQVMALYKDGKLDNIYTEFTPTGGIIERSRYEAGMFLDILTARPEMKDGRPVKQTRQPTEAEILGEMEGAASLAATIGGVEDMPEMEETPLEHGGLEDMFDLQGSDFEDE